MRAYFFPASFRSRLRWHISSYDIFAIDIAVNMLKFTYEDGTSSLADMSMYSYVYQATSPLGNPLASR